MDEAGHKTGPAACFVPAESERHAGREVGERGVSLRVRRAARIRALCARWERLGPAQNNAVGEDAACQKQSERVGHKRQRARAAGFTAY